MGDFIKMVPWWFVILGEVFGYLVGILVRIWIERGSRIGTLRVDRSDPEEGPYFFLELDKDGMDVIRQGKPVTFKVDLNGYEPRK